MNCQKPDALACPGRSQEAPESSISVVDKIRSVVILREASGTFCNIPQSKVT